MLRTLIYLPLMFVGGLHFCLFGTVLGLILYLAMIGIADGAPLRYFPPPIEWGTALALAATFGAPPAFVSGLAAAPLRLHLNSHLLFVLLMAPIGAAATATYLPILGILDNWSDAQAMVIATGALAAIGCAVPFGFWLPRVSA